MLSMFEKQMTIRTFSLKMTFPSATPLNKVSLPYTALGSF